MSWPRQTSSRPRRRRSKPRWWRRVSTATREVSQCSPTYSPWRTLHSAHRPQPRERSRRGTALPRGLHSPWPRRAQDSGAPTRGPRTGARACEQAEAARDSGGRNVKRAPKPATTKPERCAQCGSIACPLALHTRGQGVLFILLLANCGAAQDDARGTTSSRRQSL
jgi:hypothetical protein